jgi:hypothetical protein
MIEEKKVPEVPKYDSARVIVNLRIATLRFVTTLLTRRLYLGRDLEEPGRLQQSLSADKTWQK